MADARSRRERDLENFRSEQEFHEREWAIQRAGWVLLLALMAAAGAGVFGGGILARDSIAVADSHIEYDRFIRRNAATQWVVSPARNAAPDGVLRLSIDSAFLEAFEVSSITPEPTRGMLFGDEVQFEFDVGAVRSSIVFHIEAEQMGVHEGSFRLEAAPAVHVRQIVYP